MAVSITELKPIENGSIPFASGSIRILEIVSAVGDTKTDEGTVLTYKDGVPHHNYILSWVKDGIDHAFGTEASLIDIFGLREKRAEAIENYIVNRISNEIALITTKPGDFENPHIIAFTNLVDAYRDVYGEDSNYFKECWTPEIETLVDNNVYIRNALAKIGLMLEQGFNETYHEGVADSVVHLIKTSKHINSKGELSGPTMASVEDIFRMVREKLTLTMSAEVPPYLLVDENVPEILK